MTKASLAFALSVLTCALPLCALQTTQQEAERWSFHLGNRTLFLLSVVPRQSADGWSCTGSIMAPMHLQTRDAVTFTGVHGPVRTRPILACSRAGDAIALTTQDSDKAGDTTDYVLTVQSSSRATLQVKGTPLPPMEMAPAGADAAVSTDWDPAKTYATDDDVPSNADMKRIFEEDQRARMPGVKIDWKTVSQSDAERRVATLKLLATGQLHTGEDFWWASFIFQHAPEPDDYLLAHTLSAVAVKKGYTAAIWMMAATLDRYLQAIKQPQIYGTQFFTRPGEAATQAPYKRDLIPDALRRQLEVPPLAAQELQRQQYDAERHLGTAGASRGSDPKQP